MRNDCNIRNGICVFPDGERSADLEIRNGRIVGIYEPGQELSSCEQEIDTKDCLIFPGMIDTHVHIRGGELDYREDFYTGSQAAAGSGITTILEMPVCTKPPATVENFMRRIEEVKRNGAVNFGMYAAAGHDNLEEIGELAKVGAIGYKTFQMAPVAGREKEFYGMCAETYEDMVHVMQEIAKTGLTLTVHCESQAMINELVPIMKEKYPNSLRGFIDSRPPEAEAASVDLTIRAAKVTGCRTIIAHVSCPKSMELILQAKAEGYPIYAETCLQYLYFDKEEMIPYGAFARMKPPFRTRAEVDRMVELYHQGAFDVTGSDHAPYTMEEKLKHGDDIWNSVDGLYGLELSLPLLLNLVDQGKLTPADIARNFSQNAAEIFRLPGKGQIAKGYDADLVLVRKREQPKIHHKEDMRCKCKEAAVIYDNIPLTYDICRTILGGETVYDGIEVTLEKGRVHIMNY